jgi:malic enzyme
MRKFLKNLKLLYNVLISSYIFPGVGLGAVVSGATSIVDNDFIVAAEALAALVALLLLY